MAIKTLQIGEKLYLSFNYLNEFRWGSGAEEMDQEKKNPIMRDTFYLIACAPCKLLTTKHHLLLTSYELPSSPLKPQIPSTALGSGRFLRPQLPYLLFSFIPLGASLQRWLSGKTICLPVQETQETQV